MASPIPFPVPTPDNAGFWEACRRGELRLRAARVPRLAASPRPMRRSAEPGTTGRWPAGAASSTPSPSSIGPPAGVRGCCRTTSSHLDEGVYMVSNLVCGSRHRIGMAVEVVFEPLTDSYVPRFRPAAALTAEPAAVGAALGARSLPSCAARRGRLAGAGGARTRAALARRPVALPRTVRCRRGGAR